MCKEYPLDSDEQLEEAEEIEKECTCEMCGKDISSDSHCVGDAFVGYSYYCDACAKYAVPHGRR